MVECSTVFRLFFSGVCGDDVGVYFTLSGLSEMMRL